MPPEFPRRRADGSFGLELRFRGEAHEIAGATLEHWLATWAASNSEWIREWQSGAPLRVVEVDRLKPADAFARPPALADSAPLRIRLEMTPAAVFWKDWMVKLVGDFAAAFPQFEFEGVDEVE